jgi:hypothetical protein
VGGQDIGLFIETGEGGVGQGGVMGYYQYGDRGTEIVYPQGAAGYMHAGFLKKDAVSLEKLLDRFPYYRSIVIKSPPRVQHP